MYVIGVQRGRDEKIRIWGTDSILLVKSELNDLFLIRKIFEGNWRGNSKNGEYLTITVTHTVPLKVDQLSFNVKKID